MIFCIKLNEKVVKYVITMVLALGGGITLMMTLKLWLMPLKLYLWIYETTNEKNILWRVTIFFISQRMGGIDRLFITKLR